MTNPLNYSFIMETGVVEHTSLLLTAPAWKPNRRLNTIHEPCSGMC